MKLYWPGHLDTLVFVGGCVERGEGSSFRAKAHAHNLKGDPWFGYICVRSLKRIGAWLPMSDNFFDGEITKPSRTLIHELAHILTPNHGHDEAWRHKMKELGQPIRKQYLKRTR